MAAVEFNPYRQEVLRQRQRDGMLDPFPIFDDVRIFDCAPWRGKIDRSRERRLPMSAVLNHASIVALARQRRYRTGMVETWDPRTSM